MVENKNIEIGDRVICIDVLPIPNTNEEFPLVNDCLYVVNNIETCPDCNRIMLDIGILSYGKYQVCICGKVDENKNEKGVTWWFRAERFRKYLG